MKTLSKLFYLGLTFFVISTSQLLSQNGEPFSIKPLGSNSNITLTFLKEFISSQMEINHISGLAATVVVGDSVIWSIEKGLANRETNIPVEDSTLFLTYSVSKMFTGISLMQQYDKGLFDLDDDINDYLPFEVIHPLYPETTITFRMLMTHTAGITEPWSVISSVMVQGYDYPGTLHDFLESFFVPGGEFYSESHFSGFEPGTAFSYSNVGAALAGFLTESISGIPFNDYCKDSLLMPMGMDNSSFLLADINMDNLAIQYEHNGTTYIPQGHISNATLPAGFLRTSNRQMANFVKMLINNGNFEGDQIIGESTLDTITVGHIIPNENIGLLMGYDPNFQVWGHTGGLNPNEVKTLVFFHKTEKWGVSLLTNGDGDIWPIAYILEQYAREFSALSLTGFNIMDDNNNEIIEPNENADLIMSFRNSYQRIFENGKVVLKCNNPNITITDSVFHIDLLFPDSIAINQDVPFKISSSNFSSFEEIILEFEYYENDTWIGKEQYPLHLGFADILLVDDEEHHQRNLSKSLVYYKEALSFMDTSFIYRNTGLSAINQNYINQFNKVIWFTGISNQNSNILPEEEQTIIIQYLNQGGNLFLSSQNAGDYCGNTSLFNDYLKVNHIQNTWSGSPAVAGIDNDTIGNSLQFYINGGNGNNSSYSPSVVNAVNDGIPFLKYTNTNNVCGVRFEAAYKSIFTSFGIESIDNTADRIEMINRSLIWFDEPTVGLPESSFNAHDRKDIKIYPNPCKGSFNIKFPQQINGPLNIYITDLSGKQLIKKRVDIFDGNLFHWQNLKLPEGVYLININTNRYTHSGKLILGF